MWSLMWTWPGSKSRPNDPHSWGLKRWGILPVRRVFYLWAWGLVTSLQIQEHLLAAHKMCPLGRSPCKTQTFSSLGFEQVFFFRFFPLPKQSFFSFVFTCFPCRVQLYMVVSTLLVLGGSYFVTWKLFRQVPSSNSYLTSLVSFHRITFNSFLGGLCLRLCSYLFSFSASCCRDYVVT